jgi:hypothetical protein
MGVEAINSFTGLIELAELEDDVPLAHSGPLDALANLRGRNHNRQSETQGPPSSDLSWNFG